MKAIFHGLWLLALLGLAVPAFGQTTDTNGPIFAKPVRLASVIERYQEAELPTPAEPSNAQSNLLQESSIASPAPTAIHSTDSIGSGTVTQFSDSGQTGTHGSVLTQAVSDHPLFNDSCYSCGGSCTGTCEFSVEAQLGRGMRRSRRALGSNLAMSHSQSTGPMYAYFDYGGSFSDAVSAYSNFGLSNLFGHKDGSLFGAGLGRYLTDRFRVDFGVRNRYVELEDQVAPPPPSLGHTLADGGDDVWTFMFTGRYDLPGPHPCIKPYLSSGLGLAYHRAQATTQFSGFFPSFPSVFTNAETSEFAWSAGAGIAFKMTHNMFFDLDYQYIDMGDAETNPSIFGGNTVTFYDLTAHEVAFRLRFNF